MKKLVLYILGEKRENLVILWALLTLAVLGGLVVFSIGPLMLGLPGWTIGALYVSVAWLLGNTIGIGIVTVRSLQTGGLELMMTRAVAVAARRLTNPKPEEEEMTNQQVADDLVWEYVHSVICRDDPEHPMAVLQEFLQERSLSEGLLVRLAEWLDNFYPAYRQPSDQRWHQVLREYAVELTCIVNNGQVTTWMATWGDDIIKTTAQGMLDQLKRKERHIPMVCYYSWTRPDIEEIEAAFVARLAHLAEHGMGVSGTDAIQNASQVAQETPPDPNYEIRFVLQGLEIIGRRIAKACGKMRFTSISPAKSQISIAGARIALSVGYLKSVYHFISRDPGWKTWSRRPEQFLDPFWDRGVLSEDILTQMVEWTEQREEDPEGYQRLWISVLRQQAVYLVCMSGKGLTDWMKDWPDGLVQKAARRLHNNIESGRSRPLPDNKHQQRLAALADGTSE